jgi:hypothetical protein
MPDRRRRRQPAFFDALSLTHTYHLEMHIIIINSAVDMCVRNYVANTKLNVIIIFPARSSRAACLVARLKKVME